MPRRDYKRPPAIVDRLTTEHPTGTSGAVASALVAIAHNLGLELTVEAALGIVTIVTVIASAFSPRVVK